ncbi:MAG: hypothetical protein IKU64_06120 [Bacteroides sp.]|nr:hypothetical protein [Bacteroides sp.]
MKSYNHLFEQYLSEENYELAVKNATAHKGGKKRKYRKAQYYKKHKGELKESLMNYAEHFYNEKHQPKLIYDGVRRKQRTILIPSMREQVVHHMIVNVMKPIIMKSMYTHSYGSVPNRGAISGRKGKTHGGKDAVEKFIHGHPKDCKYCCKMDIHKFFDSVPHEKLKAMFRRIIHDERFLNILLTLVDANESEFGMPIGFYTSQWFANFYLTGLDHYIKEVLGAKGYFRYMDDMVVFDGNKRHLHWIRMEVERYLNEELGLEMNPKWQVFRFHYVRKDGKDVGRFLDFMGFRFYRNRTTLRRTLMLRAARKAKKIGRKKMKTVFDCRQMLSYKGWLTPSDTYRMYLKRIKPFISFQYMQRRIALYQEIENRREKQTCGTRMKMAV